MVPQLLVMSTNALLVLDQRTMVIKYRIPVTEFVGMSLSPYNDKICIFHLQKVRTTVIISYLLELFLYYFYLLSYACEAVGAISIIIYTRWCVIDPLVQRDSDHWCPGTSGPSLSVL